MKVCLICGTSLNMSTGGCDTCVRLDTKEEFAGTIEWLPDRWAIFRPELKVRIQPGDES